MAFHMRDKNPEQALKEVTQIREEVYAFLHPYYTAIQAQLNTPLNLALVLIFTTTLAYFLFIRPALATPLTLPPAPPPIVFRTFTPRILLKYNGQPSSTSPGTLEPVYLAVKGKVYDVTSGKNFYGPGGPYENFAGRDATRGLACQSFDEGMLTKDLDGPLDECEDLGEEERSNLQGWVERFEEKYLVVGKLMSFSKTKSEW